MTKPLQFFQYQDGVLTSENVPLSKIVKQVGTPVYIYSAEGFLTPFQQLKNGLKGTHHLVCFAVKSNSNLSILRLLAEAGAGVDLVSGGELFRAQKAGILPERIVFSGVGKTAEEMREGLLYEGQGILSFNVESIPELILLNQTAISLGKKAPVALRFNPDVDAKTHPYISTGLKKNKFGMNRKEILEIIPDLRRLQGIQLKGFSIHIGSQLLSLAPLDDAFAKVRELMDEIQPYLQFPLEWVDLGGGVGISYRDERTPPIQKYCQLIKRHFQARLDSHPKFKILIEPGRSISGNAGVLVSKVLYRKTRPKKDFLIIDAGMNDLIRPALYQSHHEIVPIEERHLKRQRASETHETKASLVGPVCESSDCFASDRQLPSSLESGDLVAILSAGAYGFSMSSTYNSRPRPAEVLIQDGKFRVIRRREQREDLIRGED